MVLSDAAQATCYQTSPRPTFHGAAASYSADGAYLSGIAGASVIISTPSREITRDGTMQCALRACGGDVPVFSASVNGVNSALNSERTSKC